MAFTFIPFLQLIANCIHFIVSFVQGLENIFMLEFL